MIARSRRRTEQLLPERAIVDGTRRRLLEIALVQFSERGYHGVSVRDIAVAAKVSPASIYVHHASKEALLMELMILGHEEHGERLRVALAAAPADPRERIRHLVRAHVEMHGEFSRLARVCNNEAHALTPANRRKVLAVRARAEKLFADTVMSGVQAKLFVAKNPWLSVAAIAAMGLRVAEWWTWDSPIPLSEVSDTYADFALAILTPS